MKNKDIKINLGSGLDYKEGWINVDIHADYKPDVLADITQGLPFKNDFAHHILAQDILEHMTREDAQTFIQECHRVLQKNGTLELRLPNIFAIFDTFKSDPEVLLHFIYGDTSETGTFGSHKAGYTKRSLRKLLKKFGFEPLSIHTETTNFHVLAVKKSQKADTNLTIGVIQHSPAIGGAEVFMSDLVEQWIQSGVRVMCATDSNEYKKMLRSKGVQNIQSYSAIFDVIGDFKGLIKSMLFLPKTLVTYARVIEKFKRKGVDCIVSSEFSEKMLLAVVCKIFRVPIVWIEYARLSETFTRMFPLSKIIFRLTKGIPDAIISPTLMTKQSLIVDGRVSLAKIHTIPCGTKISSSVRERKAPRAPFTIACVGRITPEKGQMHVIDAMKHVHSVLPEARLRIIGDGEYSKTLKKNIVELELQNVITCTGFVQDLEKEYKNIDLMVFPTMWELEGFGLVQIESMARGIPLVAFNTQPTEEVCGDAAVIVPQGDTHALAHAIVDTLSQPKTYSILSKRGISKVREKYDIKNVAQAWLDIFKDITLETSNPQH